jgi:uncharacterized damage-inducible protein DinB
MHLIRFFLVGLWLISLGQAQDTVRYASAWGQEFGPTWERGMAYTLEVAAAMPEAAFRFTAQEPVMDFGAQLVHIADNWYSLCSRFVTEEPFPVGRVPVDSLDKAGTLAYLRGAFAYATEALRAASDSSLRAPVPNFFAPVAITRAGIFRLMRDHMTHHRGQCVLFLRLQGIEPPRYRGW